MTNEIMWRVGRTLGRTIYHGDTFVGLVETRQLAESIVERMNAELKGTDLRETAHRVAREWIAFTDKMWPNERAELEKLKPGEDFYSDPERLNLRRSAFDLLKLSENSGATERKDQLALCQKLDSRDLVQCDLPHGHLCDHVFGNGPVPMPIAFAWAQEHRIIRKGTK
jgi:hypothetical protein